MKKLYLIWLVLFTFVLFYSCEEESTSPKDTPEPKDSCDYTIDSRLAYIYDCPPGVSDCYEGTLANAEKMKALDRLNYFRRLHGIDEVSYNPDMDDDVQKSALIAVANETLNHFPPTSDKCYSTDGDTACQRSNLHLSWYSGLQQVWSSAASIDGWIHERYSSSIGHRRWFLSPFLKTVSFGRVDQIKSDGKYLVGTTMYVWDTDGPTQSDVEFVSCPFHDYPSSAFQPDLILSFSVLANKSSTWANSNVNYTEATIQVTDESQNTYTVHSKSFDNIGYGMPNNIEWQTQGLDYNTKYTVNISNVLVGGEPRDYEYWFNIVN
ncbi:CAP domain-containing protein [Bacteroidota bacterium]